MEKKYCRSHIGEIHKIVDSLGGYKAEIIDGGSKTRYCTMRIDKWISEVSYSNLKKGKIKYPYHPSVYGKGYLGQGEYKPKTYAYNVWSNIIARCYDKKVHIKLPTYKYATVCEEWHNFQNFAKWHEENYVEGWHIDKDLLSGDNKIYSPETCLYIPVSLNSFMTNVQLNNTSGETGVSWNKKHKKWKATISIDNKQKHLGCFSNKQDAVRAYKAERNALSSMFKYDMTGLLPEKAIKNINNY